LPECNKKSRGFIRNKRPSIEGRQRAEAKMQHIDREIAKLAELWQMIDKLHQQEQRQEPPLD
jgi:transposase